MTAEFRAPCHPRAPAADSIRLSARPPGRRRLSDAVNRAVIAVTIALVAVMFSVSLFGILHNVVTGAPPSWSYSLARLFVPWIAMLSLTVAFKSGEHVAMTALAAAVGKVPAPRLQSLQGIAPAHGVSILKETVGTKVSPALVLAVIAVESAGRLDAVSSAGAQGLMQLMPQTAESLGVEATAARKPELIQPVAALPRHDDGSPRMDALTLIATNRLDELEQMMANEPDLAEVLKPIIAARLNLTDRVLRA